MKLVTVYFVAALATGSFYLTKLTLIHAQASKDVAVTPCVIATTDFIVKNGVELDTERGALELRRDGSTNKWGTRLVGVETGKTYRRVELADGFEGMIRDDLRIKSTGYMSATQLAARRMSLTNPPADCVDPDDSFDFRENLQGFDTVRVVRSPKNQPNQRQVIWKLPTVACLVVQIYFQELQNDNTWKTTQGKRLDSITLVDPPVEHFRGWESFQEMKPSDMKRAILKSQGISESQCPKCYAKSQR